MKTTRWLMTLTLLLPLAAAARDALFVVGGGPLPEESQVSIERNVRWIERLTKNRFPQSRLLFGRLLPGAPFP